MLCPPARSSFSASGKLRNTGRQQRLSSKRAKNTHSTALTTTGISEPVETLTLRWPTARKNDWMTPPCAVMEMNCPGSVAKICRRAELAVQEPGRRMRAHFVQHLLCPQRVLPVRLTPIRAPELV